MNFKRLVGVLLTLFTAYVTSHGVAQTYTNPVALPVAADPPVSAGLLGLDGGETLQPVWAQPLGPGRWVLRLNETLGRRGSARLRLASGWRASRVDLRAQPLDGGRAIDVVAYGPYALLSVLIERDAA